MHTCLMDNIKVKGNLYSYGVLKISVFLFPYIRESKCARRWEIEHGHNDKIKINWNETK